MMIININFINHNKNKDVIINREDFPIYNSTNSYSLSKNTILINLNNSLYLCKDRDPPS
jgi:hypothetical protein